MPRRTVFAAAAAAMLFAARWSFADYPLIGMTIKSRDPLYRQHQQDVEDWYSGGDEPPLAVYRYVPRASEDLFSVAAAFNLPYETLATLNGWDAPGLFTPGEALLVPNLPGIFIPEMPGNGWERRLAESRSDLGFQTVTLDGGGTAHGKYRFFPGEKFAPDERIRFLGSLFSSPLAGSRITSPFGYRPNPFTGAMSFHPGIDLKADVGTPVSAARDGVVAETGTLEIYGHYVIITHDGSYESVYAHLDEILVAEGAAVNAGDIVALSGNSGISTGPHLHFEIRKSGIPADPARLTALKER